MLVSLSACAYAAEPALGRHDAFLAMVNQVALPARMIVGERLEEDAACTLRFNDKLAQDNPHYKRIFSELLKSPIRHDIARFNRSRSPAEADLFQVDEYSCQPTEYRGINTAFRAPQARTSHPFALRYADTTRDSASLTITSSGRPVKIQSGPEKESTLDLKAVRPGGQLGDVVVLKWGDRTLADWDRRGWSVIRDVATSGEFFLRAHDPSSGSMLADVSLGSSIAFPAGMQLALYQKTDTTGVKLLASMKWKPEAGQNALFRQDDRGLGTWSREPTSFEAAIAESLRAAGSNVRTTVALTMSSGLSAALDSSLDRAARQVRQSVDLQKRNRQLYGSIAVVDTTTGDVLALAGYPQRPPAMRFAGEVYQPSRGRDEFMQRRVIGSVAKVPIGLAIVSAQPDLVTLRMLQPWGNAKFSQVFGKKVTPVLSDHAATGCGASVDFSCFIYKSLNRYAATLISAAAVRQNLWQPTGTPLGTGAFSIVTDSATRIIQTQPLGFLFAGTPTGQSIVTLPWAIEVERLFDTHAGALSGGGVHSYMWRRAVHERASSNALQSFSAVSPERENFALNISRDYRTSYIQTILGASESRWSSVKVAESFARIVTARRVNASFVAAGASNESESFAPLFAVSNRDAPRIHGIMLDAMEKVTSPVGTGKWMLKTLGSLKLAASARGLQLHVHAKTGTPNVDSFDETETGQAIQAAADAGVLTWELRGRTPQEGWRLRYDGRLIDKAALNGVPDANADEFGGPVNQKKALEFLELVNSQPGPDQARYCSIKGQSIDCHQRKVTSKETDYGRNLAMVLTLAKSDGSTCRSVAVAWGFSIKHDDRAFKQMVLETLAIKGPVATALQMNRDGTPCR